MRDHLPQEVFNRPKQGFTLPINTWMRHGLHGPCEAAVDALAACQLFDGRGVRQLWDRLHDARYENHFSRRMALVVLGSYLGSAGLR